MADVSGTDDIRMTDHEARRLDWPHCRNIRDLGGLPTTDGGRVRRGALVRSDALDRLSAAGVRALHRYGVRRVVDLRTIEEAEVRPGPFAGDPMYRLVPLVDPSREAFRDPTVEVTLAAIYRATVELNADHMAAGIATIADAPAGGVLVHCLAGKDRTGMTVALALRVAGATDAAIAADYAYTAVCLRELWEAELAAAPDGARRERVREFLGSRPETILDMLHHIDEVYGDVDTYLRANGLSEAQLGRLRDRLRD